MRKLGLILMTAAVMLGSTACIQINMTSPTAESSAAESSTVKGSAPSKSAAQTAESVQISGSKSASKDSETLSPAPAPETLEISIQTEASAPSGRVIKPYPQGLRPDSFQENSSLGTINAGIGEDSLREVNGKITALLEIHEKLMYDIVDVNSLKQGDVIDEDGLELVVNRIENFGNAIEINGGDTEDSGLSLFAQDEDNVYYAYYYELPLTRFIGYYTYPLADNCKIHDNSLLEDKDYKPAEFYRYVRENQRNYTPGQTYVTVENGVITNINIEYTP